MKLLNIVILSTYLAVAFALYDGQGKHGDGHFLSGTVKGKKACADGEFNLLVQLAGGIEGFDVATDLITNCKPCASLTFSGVYAVQQIGFLNEHAGLNRKECCFNEELTPCIEMMRAYQEGCNSGGTLGDNRPLNDAGTAGSTCST
jgi:hypothetical protein